MQLQPRHPFSAKPLLQTKGHSGARFLQDQIEVGQSLPGRTVELMQEGIANGATDQSQAAWPLESNLLDEGQRQLR